jgi:hypothetical protein
MRHPMRGSVICIYLICKHEWNFFLYFLSSLLLLVCMRCAFYITAASGRQKQTHTAQNNFLSTQLEISLRAAACVFLFLAFAVCARYRAIWESGPMACDEKQKERKSFSLSAVHSHSAPHTYFRTHLFHFNTCVPQFCVSTDRFCAQAP